MPPADDTTLQFEEPTWTVWTVNCDSAWCVKGAGIAAVLEPPCGPKIRYAARLRFPTTNNAAEYEALLLGLRKLRALRVKRCLIKTDSQVVTGHVEKEYTAREPELTKYLGAVRKMEKHFTGFTVKYMPRSENSEAGELAKAAAQEIPTPPDVFFQTLTAKAIKEGEENPSSIHAIASQDWRAPIFAFVSGSYEPEDKHEMLRMQSRTKHYSIIGGNLYKDGVVAPKLKCISKEEGMKLLNEIHSGMCGAHRGPHEIAHRAMRQGFYWPTAAEDAKQVVKTCENCQMFAKLQKAPANLTKSIIPTWLLQRWGVDIVGKLPLAPGNLQYAAVALEYFTKWIEAKSLAKITSGTLISFVWQQIICRFGVPAYITVDNGKQFDSIEFRNFCDKLNIKLSFASVNHPQSNGAVEKANGLIFTAISKALHEVKKGRWPQEMITAVWGHNISKSRATSFTPFRLLYGEEAITPKELKLGSFRTEIQPTTEDERLVELEVAELQKIQAAQNLDKYHEETKAWKDKTVLRKSIYAGDMVLIRHPDKQGKLQSQWYGPFVVASVVKPGLFRLKTEDGHETIDTWNADNLRRFYP